MQLSEAIALIDNGRLQQHDKSIWADLGCGSGLFTHALSTWLAPESTVHAIDKASLHQLPNQFGKVIIDKAQLDFVKEELPLPSLDGILMANSLHYVKDQIAFIKKTDKYLKKTGCFIIVEYDTESANPWVPYPLGFSSLKSLFTKAGYTSVSKLHERPSVYNSAMMYSALIER